MTVYILSKAVSSNLFCDNIAITYEPGKHHHHGIINTLGGMVEDGGYAIKAPRGNYRQACYLTMADDPYDEEGRMLIQYGPYNPTNRFLRVKFNPSYMDVSMAKLFVDGFVPGGYSSMIGEGKVTELHLSVDISNCSLQRLLVYYPNIKISQPILNNGDWETYYLGRRDSNLHFCIYDKVKETKAWNNSHYYHKKTLPEAPTVRIEAVLRDNHAGSLQTLGNPFNKLSISHFPKALNTADYPYLKVFLRLASHEGAHNALLTIPEADRKRFKALLVKSACAWWKPVELWDQWPALLMGLTNPPQSHLAIHPKPKAMSNVA